MIAAFPIGWTISRMVLAADVLSGVHPVRRWCSGSSGRDALRLSDRGAGARTGRPSHGQSGRASISASSERPRSRIAKREKTSNDFETARREQRRICVRVLGFPRHSKKWWLLPIVVVLVVFGVLILLSGTAAAPFIYTLF